MQGAVNCVGRLDINRLIRAIEVIESARYNADVHISVRGQYENEVDYQEERNRCGAHVQLERGCGGDVRKAV